MLQQNSRLLDIGRYIDTAVRNQKLRQFFLHLCACSIDIQNWYHHGIFLRRFLDKRNGSSQGISLDTDKDHIRPLPVMLHIRRRNRQRLHGAIPHSFHRQTLFLHLRQMLAAGNQRHIFSCLCHVKSDHTAGSASADNCVFHLAIFLLSQPKSLLPALLHDYNTICRHPHPLR